MPPKKRNRIKGQERIQVDEGNQGGRERAPGFSGIIYAVRASRAAEKGRREALRVRGREITSVVCGFSYVQEVTMVYPRVIPLPNASSSFFLFFPPLITPHTLFFSLPLSKRASWTEPVEEKQEEDEQEEEEEVAFVPTSSELDTVCHFFTFPLRPPRPFYAFLFVSPSSPLISPFHHFLVSLSLSLRISSRLMPFVSRKRD